MSTGNGDWTNEEILREVLWHVIYKIYTMPEEHLDHVREAAGHEEPHRLKEVLVSLQMSSLLEIIDLIDGAAGPVDWPGVALVNAETRTDLAEQLAWSVSEMEEAVLDAVDASDQTG